MTLAGAWAKRFAGGRPLQRRVRHQLATFERGEQSRYRRPTRSAPLAFACMAPQALQELLCSFLFGNQNSLSSHLSCSVKPQDHRM